MGGGGKVQSRGELCRPPSSVRISGPARRAPFLRASSPPPSLPAPALAARRAPPQAPAPATRATPVLLARRARRAQGPVAESVVSRSGAGMAGLSGAPRSAAGGGLACSLYLSRPGRPQASSPPPPLLYPAAPRGKHPPSPPPTQLSPGHFPFMVSLFLTLGSFPMVPFRYAIRQLFSPQEPG